MNVAVIGASAERRKFGNKAVRAYLSQGHTVFPVNLEADVIDRSRPTLKVVVPVIARISNHTDFDVLRLQPDVDFEFVGPGDPLPPADLLILPGTKSTRSDLQFLRAQGWFDAILRHFRFGGRIMGICGGLQMLGTAVHDPAGIEGSAGSSEGLGLLELETTIGPEKQLRQVTGSLSFEPARVSGYEIHAGESTGAALSRPFAEIDGRGDGAISADKRVLGTYLHGVFDQAESRAALLRWAGLSEPVAIDYFSLREQAIDRLADELERALDIDQILELIGA